MEKKIGWLSFLVTIAMTLGDQALHQDLATVLGPATEVVISTARILAAVGAAVTGAIIARRG